MSYDLRLLSIVGDGSMLWYLIYMVPF